MWNILLWVVGGLVALVVLYLIVTFIATLVVGGKPAEGIQVEVSMGAGDGAVSGIGGHAAALAIRRVGERFEILVRVRNELARVRKLGNIDFKAAYLDGIVIESVEPAPAESTRAFGYYMYVMNREVPASGEVEVRFACRAVKEGDFEGEVHVYVDSSHLKWSSAVVRTVVQAG